MAKFQTRYICGQCGYESLKWMGKCPECEGWDTFTEEVTMKEGAAGAKSQRSSGRCDRSLVSGFVAPIPITDVTVNEQERLTTGIGEFDRTLGGGLVRGGVTLVGGDPGIGKSTLLTQVLFAIGERYGNALYISGEESAQQIKLRASRLGTASPTFLISVETEISLVLRHLDETRPHLAVVDSIQTMSDSSLESAPGTVTQVRACATGLTRYAKSTGTPIVLIGHVTKEGSLAGPRVLEHIVDTVLYFEGDRYHTYRLLRAAKNRFGSTDELGIFEMRESGLEGVENPSALLLSERAADGTGSAVTSTMEGTRALLVEVQALVSRSNLASPRRVVTGMDPNRVNMILAVLEKRVGLKIAEQDAFVNVAGGIRILEPAADLATAIAIASNFREQPVHPTTILLGEIGLAGEVRAVSQLEKRLREATRQGFTRAIVSRHNLHKMPSIDGMEVLGINLVHEAFDKALQAQKY